VQRRSTRGDDPEDVLVAVLEDGCVERMEVRVDADRPIVQAASMTTRRLIFDPNLAWMLAHYPCKYYLLISAHMAAR
jgi:hypothetical protein